ncbi:uncharacterized protein DNG_03295 [Cephalotrichum gorgonifer]|uniref:DRBM domain-containing protein n=1 Tax=Cephalotrichum gorgonifer TaxID=2041049 RepID=A0AAE8MW36_9PEZI|nr:uncharacterized protein DNG_03295 [Cephalotrichum gorgonifer]
MNSTWTALRLWINEKETAELRSGGPAQLTAAQRHAINTLVPGAVPVAPGLEPSPPRAAPATPPRSSSGPDIDPEFERGDWVSRLTHYTQSRNRPPAEFSFVEHDVGPKMPKKWAGFCTLSYEDGSFPNSEYGFLKGEAPCFSNKKDAKQYASMCAMRYTQEVLSSPRQNFMARTPPTPSTPTPSALRLGGLARGNTGEYEDFDDSNGVRLAPQSDADASAGPSGSESDVLAAQRSAREKAGRESMDEPEPGKQITALCKALKLTPPRFVVTPHETLEYHYDVHPIFPEPFTEDVPKGLGVVNEILTKVAAKEAAERQVLDWLKEIESQRHSDYTAILPAGSVPH